MKIKKILSMLAVATLALATFAFSACGEYKPPVSSGDDPPTPIIPDPPQGDDPTPAEDGFTVQLVTIDGNFTESDYDGLTRLQVQWTDKDTGEVYRSEFSEKGLAKRTDLDGDYSVTLPVVPEGYTYRPNDYEATNYDRNVKITLFKLNKVSGNTAACWFPPDNAYVKRKKINSLGAYRVTIESPGQKVWFMYTPQRPGVYTIESLADITQNEINPYIEMHEGSSVYIASEGTTVDGGGVQNTYTKNFLWEMNLANTGPVFNFAVYAECSRPDEVSYPLSFDFFIDRDGDYSSNIKPAHPRQPEHDFSTTPEMPQGKFTFCAYRNGDVPILDERTIKLNPDDGYYYYCQTDENGNPIVDANGKYIYLERIYANLTGHLQMFTDSEQGNISATPHRIGLGDMTSNFGYVVYGKQDPVNYYPFYNEYKKHAAGGTYPVTEELKEFLQAVCVSQRWFNDGNGLAELGNDKGIVGDPEDVMDDTAIAYSSDEESQWLFACGYYK